MKPQKIGPAIGLIIGLLLTIVPVSFLHAQTAPKTTAAIFSDIGSSPYKDAISYLQTNGIVTGYSDGTFKPALEINRAEFTKILVGEAFPKEIQTYAAKSCFKDVLTSDWFSKYVCLAKDKGVIGGYSDGTFRPAQNINVAESLKISLETLAGQAIPDAAGAWYQKYLNLANSKGYMLNEWSDISKKISRGEMAQFLYKIIIAKAPAGNITLSNYDGATIAPFNVITLKGSGFDPLAATSVVFTIQGGSTYVIPAIAVTSDTVEVSVPAVNYNESTNLFSGAKASLKVIQIKESGVNLAVKTSNKLEGLNISVPQIPSVLNNTAAKSLPKGTLTRAYLAVSLVSLKSVKDSLPNTDTKVSASLTKAQASLTGLMADVKTLMDNPAATVQLKTNTATTVPFNAAMLSATDAIYSGVLGIAEKNGLLASGEGSFALIPLANAATVSGCTAEAIGYEYPPSDKISDTENSVIEAVCASKDSTLAANADESKVKFEQALPVTLGSMALAAKDATALNMASKITLSNSYPLIMDKMRATKKVANNASDWLAKTAVDQLINIGSTMDEVYDMFQSYDAFEEHYILYPAQPLDFGTGIFFYVMATPFANMLGTNGFNPDLQLIKFNYGVPQTTTTTDTFTDADIAVYQAWVRRLALPTVDSTTLVLDPDGILNGGFDTIPNYVPHEPQTQECTEPKMDIYNKCLSGCASDTNLIEKAWCTDACIGNWRDSTCP